MTMNQSAKGTTKIVLRDQKLYVEANADGGEFKQKEKADACRTDRAIQE